MNREEFRKEMAYKVVPKFGIFNTDLDSMDIIYDHFFKPRTRAEVLEEMVAWGKENNCSIIKMGDSAIQAAVLAPPWKMYGVYESGKLYGLILGDGRQRLDEPVPIPPAIAKLLLAYWEAE